MVSVSDLVEKKEKFYKVKTGDVNKDAEIRRKALEEISGAELEFIGKHSLDLNITEGRNIETPIGVTQIPLGVAGPVKIKGDFANGDFYVPLATTEGALVASITRGMSASGEIKTAIFKDAMTRGPVLVAKDVTHAREITAFVKQNFKKIKEIFESTSAHANLKEIDSWIIGRNVFLRFVSETGEAMGMNMLTKATTASCEFIDAETGSITAAVSGNMCIDKKPGIINVILGRGKTVQAETVISRDVIEKKLKSTPEAMHDTYIRKVLLGSSLAGSFSKSLHAANIVAAIFLATGQDAAQIVESSNCITTVEITPNGDLYASVTLPSVEIGTVGGGTRLPTQKEALKIIGCQGENSAKKLSEIIAASVLSGELSLLASLSVGTLSSSHMKLGRGKKL